MNKIFKVIWSKSKQCYVVVSEIAKNKTGKKKTVMAAVFAALTTISVVNMGDTALAVNGTGNRAGFSYANAGVNFNSTQGLAIGVSSGDITSANGNSATVAIGSHSTARGSSSVAIGGATNTDNSDGQVALGWTSTAGAGAVSIGGTSNNLASGAGAVAIGGQANSAVGDNAVAIGNSRAGVATKNSSNPYTAANNAVAIGGSTAGAAGAVAIAGATASQANTIAIGNASQAAILDAIAVGNTAQSKSGYAIAVGSNSNVGTSANNAIAIGKGAAIANGGVSAISIGTNAASNSTNTITIGQNATTNSSDSIALGTGSIAGVDKTDTIVTQNKATNFVTQNNYDISIGQNSRAAGVQSVSVGSQALALGDFASAFGGGGTNGIGATKAIGVASTAIGTAANTSQNYATAVGYNAGVSAASGVAIGKDSSVGSGANSSIAIGDTASTAGANAVALGNTARATVDGGVAIGSNSTAGRTATAAVYTPATTVGDITVKTYTPTLTSAYTPSYAAVSVGDVDNNKSRQIIGVAAGRNDTDAVNVAQLKNMSLAVKGNAGKGSHLLSSEALTIKGADNSAISTTASDGNVTINLDTSKLGWTLQSGSTKSSITPGTTVRVNPGSSTNITTSLSGNTLTIDTSRNVNFDILRTQIATVTNSATIAGVQINNDGINLGSSSSTRKITNLADGSATNDAVNYGQLLPIQNTANNANTTANNNAAAIANMQFKVQAENSVMVPYRLGNTADANQLTVKGDPGFITTTTADGGNGNGTLTIGLSQDAKTKINTVEDNTRRITANERNIQTNTDTIATNTTNIGKNTTAINTLGANTIKLGGDNSSSTDAQALNKTGGLQFNITGDKYISTNASGSGVSLALNTTELQNATAFTVQGEVGKATTIKGGDTLVIEEGQNIGVRQNGKTITINTNPDVLFDTADIGLIRSGDITSNDRTIIQNGNIDTGTVAVGGKVNIDSTGIDVGTTQIRNVASGGTTRTNAANIGDVQDAVANLSQNLNTSGDTGTGSVNLKTGTLAVTGDTLVSTAATGSGISVTATQALKDAVNNANNAANKDLGNLSQAGEAKIKSLAGDASKFTVKANTDAGEEISGGDVIDFKNGDNIAITRTGSDFTIATKKDVTFDSATIGGNTAINNAGITTNSVTAGSTVIDNLGLTNGNTLIDGNGVTADKFTSGNIDITNNIISGLSDATADDEAVNKGQLDRAVNTLGTNTFTLKADTNDTAPQVLNRANGLSFKIAGDGDLISTKAVGNTVSVTASQALKDAVNNANNAANKDLGNLSQAGEAKIKSLAGDASKFTVKANTDTGEEITGGDVIDFKDGDNIAITRTGSDFTIATKKDVSFDSATIGGNTTINKTGITTNKVVAGNTTIDNNGLTNGTTSVTGTGVTADKFTAGNVVMNGATNKISGLSDATAADEAINKGQLDTAINNINSNANKLSSNTFTLKADATDTTAQRLDNNGGLAFKVAGDGDLISTTAAGDTVTVSLTKGSLTNNADGTVNAATAGAATTGDVATVINQAINKATGDQSLKIGGDTAATGSVNLKNDTLSVKGDNKFISTAANGNDITLTVNEQAIKDAAKSASTFKVKANATNEEEVKGGDTITFNDGDNIAITQTGKTFTIGTKADVNFTSVTTGNSVMDTNGFRNGTTNITGTGVTADTFKAGNTTINTTGLTNGNTAITSAGVTADSANIGGKVSINNAGIDAGNTVITNVASGGTTRTNAANVGDVQDAVANLSQNLTVTDGNTDGVVDLKNQKLTIAGTGAATSTVAGQTVTINVAEGTLSTDAAGQVNGTTGVAKAGDVATVINQAITKATGDVNLNTSGDTGTGSVNLKTGTLAVTGDTLVSTAATGSGISVTATQALKDAVDKANNAATKDLDNISTAGQTVIKNLAGDASKFKVKANTDAGEDVVGGSVIDFKNGDNIEITRTGLDFKIATAKNVTFDSATIGGTTINNNGITTNKVVAGNTTIDNNGLTNGTTSVTGAGVTADKFTAGNVVVNGNTNKISGLADATANDEAINKGQFDNAINDINNKANTLGQNTIKLGAENNTATGTQQLNKTGGLQFNVVGDNDLITTSAAGDTVTVSLTKGSLTNNADGTVNAATAGAATTGDVAIVINQAINKATGDQTLKIGGDTAATGSVNLKNDTLSVKGDNKFISTAANGNDITLTVNEQAIKDAAKSASTFKVKANTTNEEEVKGGDTITFNDGDNIAITQTGKTFTIGTKADVNFTSVTTGNSVMDTNGFRNGTTNITGTGVTADTLTAGNTTINTTGLTNGNTAITSAGVTADSANIGGKVSINNAGINAGNTVITNVASGAGSDTNAANIGDVKTAVNNVVNNLNKTASISYKSNGGTAKTTTLENGLDFTNGNFTTTAIDDNGVVKVNVTQGTLTPNTTDGTVAGTPGVATAPEVAAAINNTNTVLGNKITTTANTINTRIDDLTLNTAGNSGTGSVNLKDQSLSVTGTGAATTTANAQGIVVNVAEGQLTTAAGVVSGTAGVAKASEVATAINTLGNNTIKLGGNTGTTDAQALNKDGGLQFNINGDGTYIKSTATGSAVNLTLDTKALDDAAKNASKFNIKANNEANTGTIAGGDTLTFNNGDNIEITRDNQSFKIATAKNVSFDKVTTGGSVMDTNGFRNGTTSVTGSGVTADAFTAGNTTINTTGLTNGNTAITSAGVTADSVNIGGKVTINNTGINAGNTVITNVASGAGSDTNAANIGDVKTAVNNVVNNLNKTASISYKSNSGTAKTTTLENGLDFTNGNLTTTSIEDNGVVKVNVTQGTLTPNTTDGTVAGTLGVATAPDVAAAINNTNTVLGNTITTTANTINTRIDGLTLNTSGNSGTGSVNLKDQTLSVTGTGAATTTASAQGIVVNVAEGTLTPNTTDGSVTASTNGVATVSDVARVINNTNSVLDGKITTLGNNTIKLGGNTGTTNTQALNKAGGLQFNINGDGTYIKSTATGSAVNLSLDTTELKNATAFKVKANGDTGEDVKGGDAVDFINGDNIEVTRNGRNFTIGTAKNVSFDKVTTGNSVMDTNGFRNGTTNITGTGVTADSANIGGKVAINNTGINAGNTVITNVASGAGSDTNAANMGDVKTAVNNVVNNLNKTASISYKSNGGTAKTTTLENGLDFTNGNLTTTAIDDNGVVKVNVTQGTLTPNTTDGTVAGTAGVATAPDVAAAINNTNTVLGDTITTTANTINTRIDGLTLNTSGNSGTGSVNLKDQILSVTGTGAATTTVNGQGIVVDVAEGTLTPNTTDGTVTAPTNGVATVSDVARVINNTNSVLDGKITTLGNNTIKLGGDNNTSTATQQLNQANGLQFNINGDKYITTTASGTGVSLALDTTELKNATAFKVKANGDTGEDVKGGDAVDFINGDNIEVTRNGRNFTIGTAKNVSFDKVTTGGSVMDTNGFRNGSTNITGSGITTDSATIGGNTTITKDGVTTNKATVGNVVIDGATNKISGLADGTANNDAVNKGQLDTAINTVNNNTTRLGNNTFKLSAGDNTSTNTQTLNKDGGLEFKINGDNDLISTSAAGDVVTVSVAKGRLTPNTTDGTVAGTAGVATAPDVAAAINNTNTVLGNKITTTANTINTRIDGLTLNTAGNSGTGSVNLKDQILSVTGTGAATTTANAQGIVVNVAEGQLSTTAGVVSGTTGVAKASEVATAINTLGNNTIKLGGNTGTTDAQALNKDGGLQFNINGDGTYIKSSAKDSAVTLSLDTTELKNATAFKVKANNNTEETVQGGDTVTFNNGDNIEITQTGKTFQIGTAQNVNFTSVTTGGSVMDTNGFRNGSTNITGSGITANTFTAGSNVLDKTGLTVGDTTITKDGVSTNKATVGNVVIDSANNKISGLADGTANNDAVNKGQLDTAVSGVTLNTAGNSGTGSVNLKDQTLSVTGTGAATTTANGQGIVVNVAEGQLSTTAGVVAGTTGVAKASEVATAINALGNNTIKLGGNTGTTDTQALNKAGGLQFNINGDGTYIKSNATGSAVNLSLDTTELKNATAFKVKANKDTDEATIKGGDTLTFNNGDNIEITRDNQSFKIGTAQNVNFTSVTTGGSVMDTNGFRNGTTNITGSGITANAFTAGDNVLNQDGLTAANTTITKDGVSTNKVTVGPVVITNNGIDAGDKQITNVASGGTTRSNAANIGDLQDAVSAVNLKFSGDTSTTGTINLKDNTLAITGDGKFISTAASNTGVALTINEQAIKDAAKSAATFNVKANGNPATAVQGGDTIAFNNGKNIEIEQNGTTFTVKTSDNVAFDTATIGGTTTIDSTGVDTNKATIGGNTTIDSSGVTTNTAKIGDNTTINNDGVNTNKVVAGNTTIDTNGFRNGTTTITGSGVTADRVTVGPVTIDKTNGINAGNTVISNVKAGTADTDAVNVSQLTKAINDATDTKNIRMNYSANGGKDESVSLADGLDFQNGHLTTTEVGPNGVVKVNVTEGNVTIGPDGKASATTPGVTTADTVAKVINDAQSKVFDGRINFNGDNSVAGDANTSISRGLNQSVEFVGGADKSNLSDNNIGVNVVSNKMEIKLAKNLGGLNSATFNDAAGNTTVVNGNGMTIQAPTPTGASKAPAPVSLTANGLDNGGNRITNVAPGQDDLDAVNVAQLKAVGGNTEAALANLRRENQRVGAQAAAMAALKPIQYDPLEPTQFMAGIGNYRGETAGAIGIAHYTNEDTMFNIGVSIGNDNNMINAGVTHKFGSSAEKKYIPDRYKAGPISSVYVMQTEVSNLQQENAQQKHVISDQQARLDAMESENARQKQQLDAQQKSIEELKAAVDALLARG